jgi:hypothetical protein
MKSTEHFSKWALVVIPKTGYLLKGNIITSWWKKPSDFSIMSEIKNQCNTDDILALVEVKAYYQYQEPEPKPDGWIVTSV